MQTSWSLTLHGHLRVIEREGYRALDNAARRELDIWMMDEIQNGWSEPRIFVGNINSEEREHFPTLTKTGALYFGPGRAG